MTLQGHVATAPLKQANKEDNTEAFFICLHLKKLWDPKQHDVKV